MSLTKWLNNNKFKEDFVSDYCLFNDIQFKKLSHFNFLRGLAPGLLDGFSIGRYEEKRESFDLFAAKFETRAMRFSGGKLLRRWSPFKTGIPPLSFYY